MYREDAIEKLNEENKSGKFGKYGAVMKNDVCKALEGFCRQDEEFAQAVVQGGSFADCMAAVEKEVHGSSISDMKAFGAAVSFYFPGAGLDVKMTVNLCASVEGEADEPTADIVVDLSDFFS